MLLYYYETSGRLVFVRFIEEIEDTKKTFQNYLTFRPILFHQNFFDLQSKKTANNYNLSPKSYQKSHITKCHILPGYW